MKKQFIAKLVVLCLALAMLPTAAFAARVEYSGTVYGSGNAIYGFVDGERVSLTQKGDVYYYNTEDTDPSAGTSSSTTTDPTEDEEPAPKVVEKIEDVKTETNDDGQTVATATVETTVADDGSASIEVTDAAVEDLIAQVGSDADVVVLAVDAEDASKATVAIPAESLVKLATETGADLTVESAVASITISNEALTTLFEDVETVEIVAEAKDDGTVEIAVLADGKVVEDIPGGLTVVIPVEVEASEVANVYLVLEDGTEVKLEWKIVDGKLQVNVTASGTIRIEKK